MFGSLSNLVTPTVKRLFTSSIFGSDKIYYDKDCNLSLNSLLLNCEEYDGKGFTFNFSKIKKIVNFYFNYNPFGYGKYTNYNYLELYFKYKVMSKSERESARTKYFHNNNKVEVSHDTINEGLIDTQPIGRDIGEIFTLRFLNGQEDI